MPYRKEQLAVNTFYHIYNRGNNKENIFFEEENYLYFSRLLKTYLSKGFIRLHAYCFMPNHYHAIVETTDNSNLSIQIQHCMIAYAKAINKRYNRVGHLFQDRFKVKHIDSTEYLLHLSRYIHTNPVFGKLVSSVALWPFSSYHSYVTDVEETGLTTQFILSHFNGKEEYKLFVETFVEEKFMEMYNNFWK